MPSWHGHLSPCHRCPACHSQQALRDQQHADMDSQERSQTFSAVTEELETARTSAAAPSLREPGWEDPALFGAPSGPSISAGSYGSGQEATSPTREPCHLRAGSSCLSCGPGADLQAWSFHAWPVGNPCPVRWPQLCCRLAQEAMSLTRAPCHLMSVVQICGSLAVGGNSVHRCSARQWHGSAAEQLASPAVWSGSSWNQTG